MLNSSLSRIATSPVIILNETASIREALRVMDEKNIHALVITGGNGLRLLAAKDVFALRVAGVDFAVPLCDQELPEVLSLYPDDKVVDGLTALQGQRAEYLCLVNHHDELVGIVKFVRSIQACRFLR